MNPVKLFIDGAIAVAKMLGKKLKLSELLGVILPNLLSLLSSAQAAMALDTKEKVDAFLETLDSFTGVDVGALDIQRDMTAQAEEEAFDGIKQFARAVLYAKIGVPGYKEGA